MQDITPPPIASVFAFPTENNAMNKRMQDK